MILSISSVDIAIFSKVNELAYRYGLKASDAVATLEATADGEKEVLCFSFGPTAANKRNRFEKMLASIGCNDRRLEADTTYEIEDALDAAIQKAPKIRQI